MHWLTKLFVAALALHACVQVWLAWRQCRAVRLRRGEVPPVFIRDASAASQAKACDYTIAKQRLAGWHAVFDAVVLLWLTLGGGLDGFFSLAAWFTGQPLLQGTLHVLLTAAFLALVSLPFSLYRQFSIEQRFGFNRMTATLFVADTLKSWLLGGCIAAGLVLGILATMQLAGRAWWLIAWLGWLATSLLMVIVWPRWIAPLFNRFTPMTDQQLRTSIDALLSRHGFAVDDVFVMDGSRRSAHGNAYFTGFGRHKRIVFFDTLLNALTPAQTVAVLAHELAHFRLHHVGQRLAVMSVVSLVGFALLAWLGQQSWFYSALGVNRPGDSAALLLFVLVTPVFAWMLGPLSAAWSRRHEFEADAFACLHSDARDLADALVRLYHDSASTLTPDPVYSAFYDSHPPPAVRIARLRGRPPATTRVGPA
jgi:STE24 endopeptidase